MWFRFQKSYRKRYVIKSSDPDDLNILQSKDQPELATQMDTLLAEYEKLRAQLITWFGRIFYLNNFG